MGGGKKVSELKGRRLNAVGSNYCFLGLDETCGSANILAPV
jgi:hypothetical protein